MSTQKLSRQEFEARLRDRELTTANDLIFQLESCDDGAIIHRITQAKFSLQRLLQLKSTGKIKASTFGEYRVKDNPVLRYLDLMNNLYRVFERGAFKI